MLTHIFISTLLADFVAIKKAGEDCYSTARETSGLCKTTIEKANEMVTFGRDLQMTLENVVESTSASSKDRGLDASKFAIIQNLVEGDKIKEATQLAKDLSGLSLECVDKSKQMITAMESGIDALVSLERLIMERKLASTVLQPLLDRIVNLMLIQHSNFLFPFFPSTTNLLISQPDAIEPFVENKIAKANKKGSKKGDPELPDVQGSVKDLRALVDDVESVNLFTVLERGNAAFHGLRRNGELSKDMFASIQDFAQDVETVSGSFREFKKEDFKSLKTLGQIRAAAKSAWRCLRLSSLIKEFAEQVGELIQWIISLFQIASKKLGAIWHSSF